jgi:putative NADH-flavin reductase
LVVGASGATGKLLVNELLNSGEKVKIIVRNESKLPAHWDSPNLTVIRKNVSEIHIDEMCEIVRDCKAVASCLGHNLTWKGIFGKPRRLVTQTVALICEAIIKNGREINTKFVLMNTAGNRNRDLNEPITIKERIVISLLRALLPPHPDNEKAADYLRLQIGQNNPHISWVAVRPDNLLHQEKVSKYTTHQSPTRSAIFNAGTTSRINVAHFMASLISHTDLWENWKGKMPVIYNEEKQESQ